MTTDYQIVPQARYASEIALLEEGWPFEGAPSTGFDIWEDGCSGTGCNVNLRSNLETYTAQGDFGLAASQLSPNLVNCPTQRVIFSGKTFFHVTTGDESEAVFLVTHITEGRYEGRNQQRTEARRAGASGSSRLARGSTTAPPTRQQTIGGRRSTSRWRRSVPNKKTATQFAPCIVSQSGDDNGGSFIRGYVLGGDPPRRT